MNLKSYRDVLVLIEKVGSGDNKSVANARASWITSLLSQQMDTDRTPLACTQMFWTQCSYIVQYHLERGV